MFFYGNRSSAVNAMGSGVRALTSISHSACLRPRSRRVQSGRWVWISPCAQSIAPLSDNVLPYPPVGAANNSSARSNKVSAPAAYPAPQPDSANSSRAMAYHAYSPSAAGDSPCFRQNSPFFDIPARSRSSPRRAASKYRCRPKARPACANPAMVIAHAPPRAESGGTCRSAISSVAKQSAAVSVSRQPVRRYNSPAANSSRPRCPWHESRSAASRCSCRSANGNKDFSPAARLYSVRNNICAGQGISPAGWENARSSCWAYRENTAADRSNVSPVRTIPDVWNISIASLVCLVGEYPYVREIIPDSPVSTKFDRFRHDSTQFDKFRQMTRDL